MDETEAQRVMSRMARQFIDKIDADFIASLTPCMLPRDMRTTGQKVPIPKHDGPTINVTANSVRIMDLD